MSDPLLPSHALAPYSNDTQQLQAWQDIRPGSPAPAPSPLDRPIAAIRRYKWLLIVIVLFSTALGVAATRVVSPQYEVQARIMIAGDSPMENRSGPIRASVLLAPDDWSSLLRSGTISDAVVRKLTLYLRPGSKADAPIFRGFDALDGFVPGKYELDVDHDNHKWTLAIQPSGRIVDSGSVADSVGRRLGFLWVPKIAPGTGVQKVKFTLSTPRETALKLSDRLVPQRRPESNFLVLVFQDPNAALAANILNTWSREFIDRATKLKKQKLVEYTSTLEGQTHTAKTALDDADLQLSNFKINTITQPREGGSPIAAGVQETRDPVMKDYFDRQLEAEQLKRDIQMLRGVMPSIDRDSVPSEALLQVRAVASNPAAENLRSALTEYRMRQGRLDTLLTYLTDQNPQVKNVMAQMTTLRREKIPQTARQLLRSLEIRAEDDSVRLASATVNIKQIPERTIEEERLRRNRDGAASLFTNLQTRLAEAQLAEASTAPDVTILDSAIAPLTPAKNTAPKLILMAIMGGIGGALGLALLLDRLDSKLRYPEQATDELGLNIAGTVPRFPKRGVDQNSPEQMFQLIEAFRSLRMSVANSQPSGPVSIAISSPSPGEGKSLISANLAMSFADAGLRTVLVDGDTRRGVLHEMFALTGKPGLTDYLSGAASLSTVLRPTAHESLMVIASGTRRRQSPELLTSARLPALVSELRGMFDVVVFDTPPLAAGVDGYSIAAATGNLLVVLRVGKTLRRLAAEKLRMFERLPVNVVGAVLNGIGLDGAYSYYGYVPGYAATDESDQTDVVRMS